MLWMTIALVAALLAPVHAGAETVDQFEQLTEWTASSSPGADVEIAQDTGREGMGMAMRIDFDFHGKPGYVLVHKDFSLDLPPNYAFSFDLHGEAPQNNLEFKVIDQTGKNVWWYDQRDYDFPLDWQHVIIRRPRLQFAWGPAGGGYPERVGAIEFAISTGSGGAGSVWIDDLRLEEREPASRFDLTATVRASTSVPGHEPQMIFDHDPATSWRSGSRRRQPVAADRLPQAARVRRAGHRLGSGRLRHLVQGRGLRRRGELEHGLREHARQRRARLRLHARRRIALHPPRSSSRAVAARATASSRSR